VFKLSFLNSYRGLPKSIYILFIVQVINRFGDFVVPFLTLFLVKQLGFTMVETGFVVTLTALAVIPGAYVGGKMSDHMGRKVAYIVFQGSAAVLLFSCGFLIHSKWLVGLVVASSFFSGGVRPVLNALITDILPPEQRKAGFSLSYLGINLGVAFGPMVAGLLFNTHLPWIFIGDALTSFLAVALVIFKIDETMPVAHTAHQDEREKSEEGNIVSVLLKRPEILAFFAINMLYSIAYRQHTFGLPVQLNEQFGALGSTYFGFMMSVNAITVVAMTLPLNHLTRHLKPIKIMVFSGLLYGIGFGMIAFVDHIAWYVASTVIWSLGEILAATSFGVYLASRSPQNFRARINAVSTVFFSIAAVIGTSGIGYFSDQFGFTAMWLFIGAISVLGAIGMNCLND
jgi:MFS family permease